MHLIMQSLRAGDDDARLLMFRAAEHAQVIVVHTSVRDACVAAGMTGMVVVRPEALSL